MVRLHASPFFFAGGKRSHIQGHHSSWKQLRTEEFRTGVYGNRGNEMEMEEMKWSISEHFLY